MSDDEKPLPQRLRAAADWDEYWWWDAPNKTFGSDSPESLFREAAERVEALEAIVRDLAEAEPCTDDEFDANAGPCVFCGAEPVGIDRSPDGLGGDEGLIPAQLSDHDPSCCWRRAVELMPTQPEGT